MPVRSRAVFGPTRVIATVGPNSATLYTVPSGRTLILRSLVVVSTVSTAPQSIFVEWDGPGTSVVGPVVMWTFLEDTINRTRSNEVVSGLSRSYNAGDIIRGGLNGGSIIPSTAWFWGSGSLLLGEAT